MSSTTINHSFKPFKSSKVKNSKFDEAQCCLSLIRSLHSIRAVCHNYIHISSNQQLQRWQLDKHQDRRPLVFSLLRSHPDVVARMRNKLEIRKKLSPDTSCFILYAYWSLIIYFEALEFSRTSLRTTCTYYVMHIAHYNVQDTFVAEASSYVKGRTS